MITQHLVQAYFSTRCQSICPHRHVYVKKISPVTGLEWSREFQEVKLPRSHDNGTGWW